jgi:4-hydroxy-3-methylbut-2-en-1-yl diphosphate synthase IspG/GcpE
MMKDHVIVVTLKVRVLGNGPTLEAAVASALERAKRLENTNYSTFAVSEPRITSHRIETVRDEHGE